MRQFAMCLLLIGSANSVMAQPSSTFTAASFSTRAVYPGSRGADAVALADFDGDGILDMATVDTGTSEVAVRRSDRAGVFQPLDYIVVANAIAAGDFNGDGKPDVVTAHRDSGNLSVLLGRGDGGLDAAGTVGVGRLSRSLEVRDFNNDRISDIAAIHPDSTFISILLSNGDGTFQRPNEVEVAAGLRPGSFGIVVADFDGDGNTDLTSIDQGIQATGLTLFRGTGNGTFRTPLRTLHPPPSAFGVGDFNKDGKAELILTARTSSVGYRALDVSVLSADANGSFHTISLVTHFGGWALGDHVFDDTSVSALYAADFNGDGVLDLLLVHPRERIVFGEEEYFIGGLSVLIGLGDLTFRTSGWVRNMSQSLSAVIPADLNGDGKSDLVVAWGGYVRVVRELDHATSESPVNTVVSVQGIWAHDAVTGDFNADGRADIAFVEPSGIRATSSSRIGTAMESPICP